MFTVTLTFGIWPPKPIGYIFIKVDMSAKFDEDVFNSLVFMGIKRLFSYMSIATLTFDLQIL